jgi:hypothetical protein
MVIGLAGARRGLRRDQLRCIGMGNDASSAAVGDENGRTRIHDYYGAGLTH